MIPHKQLFRHDPANGIWGDCYRTVIACLLDLNPADVPHFGADGADGVCMDRAARKWLAKRGLGVVEVAYDCTLEALLSVMASTARHAWYGLSGTSRTGCNHIVIARGGEIVHDPSQIDAGIVGPCDDGFYWVTFIIATPVLPRIRGLEATE